MIQWLFYHIKIDIKQKYNKTFIKINDLFINNSKKLIVPIEESRIIVFTSLGFCIPAYYAYNNEKYYYAYLSLITSGISILYWSYPTYGWRRNLDLCFAKISFTIYFLTACKCIKDNKNPYFPLIVYTGTPMMLLLYNLSCNNPGSWWIYHSSFHTLINIHKMFIIHSLI